MVTPDASILLAQVAGGQYEDALGVDAQCTRAQINRAHIRKLHEHKDYAGVREALNKAKGVLISEQPAVKARRLLNLNRPEPALSFLANLGGDDLGAEEHHIMGCILLRLGRSPEAISHLESAVTQRGTPSDHLWLGNAYENVDRLDEALVCYEHAVKTRGNADECRQLGNMLVRLERFDEALPFYDRAVHLGFTDSELERRRRAIAQRRKMRSVVAATSRLTDAMGLTGENWPRLMLLVAISGLAICCAAVIL